ncbi:unnamed protein product [Cochlearia groenlandica]
MIDLYHMSLEFDLLSLTPVVTGSHKPPPLARGGERSNRERRRNSKREGEENLLWGGDGEVAGKSLPEI